jgi:hypothetical protein
MSYELKVAEKGEYLHVRVTGENSPETVRGYLLDVYLACSERDSRAVLIEEDLRGPSLGVVDIYQIISDQSRKTWPRIRRIAYVDVNCEHDAARMRFAETIAVNRGVNVRVFPNVAEAEKWLLETAR